ncbi:protein FAR1-RELATED SEQUENCE 5-like [Bidens hawaiensis]|uniref:protein FAR1-RELATED SEQUENCE 5-like n=1 Tax=Bidens hawaiensis TaxID=980011 RepID=UPI0040495B05
MNDGILKSKYFTCSKEGHKPPKSYDPMVDKDSSKQRKRPTIRCGCRAQIFLKSMDGIKFEINEFVEGQYHAMVEEEDKHFVRSNRKLTHVQEVNIKVGPVKAFNILRTKYGGFEEVGASKDDCKNFKQRLNCFIGEFDAEMVVQRLSGKKCYDDFSFEYNVNDNGELTPLFWADEISKKNYLAFEFETKWLLIMKEYDLESNKWLIDMFDMRYDWIPAYYRDEPLSGLMHTTSR